MTHEELLAEIAKLKKQVVQLIKEKIYLKNERDDWKKKFEELSVSKLKTVRFKMDGEK